MVSHFLLWGSSRPRDQTHKSCVSCMAGRFFTTEPFGKHPEQVMSLQNSFMAECPVLTSSQILALKPKFILRKCFNTIIHLSFPSFSIFASLFLSKQGCILSPCLFNLYAGYIFRNSRLDEAQAGIKIARRNINNLRYADDTTLMAESEELKSLLMKV